MERHTKFDNTTEKPKSWNDLLGPFFHYDKLPEAMQDEDGLIVLETSSGQKVCPTAQFEFDPTIISEDGRISLPLIHGLLRYGESPKSLR